VLADRIPIPQLLEISKRNKILYHAKSTLISLNIRVAGDTESRTYQGKQIIGDICQTG
jgi:hypothetical protein